MKSKKLLAAILAVAMILGMMVIPAFATEDTSDEECSHTNTTSWAAGENSTCVKTCKDCGKVFQHDTEGVWEAPRTGSNTASNYCYRTCTVEGCGRRDGHPIKGEWQVTTKEEVATRTCETCGAVQECDHSCGWQKTWRTEGDRCVRHCLYCSLEDSHESQWSEYQTPANNKNACTGRYCEATDSEGKVCSNIDRIDTVEELLEAIASGLEVIRPDAWERYPYDTSIMEIKNSPITVTEDVIIDGGEGGVIIQRLGFGYGDTKKPTFIVENGATLTLKNLTIKGGNGDMYGDFMIVVNSGTVILDDGAVLKNGGTYLSGSVINLNGGDLVMNEGSKITENIYGGGSAVVVNEGTFTMNGGEISGNNVKAVRLDGSRYNADNEPEGAVFIMNGGSISENQGDQWSAGVVEIVCGTATINGGEISDNAGGGIVMGEGSLTVNGGEISGNSGLMATGIVSVYALGGADTYVPASVTINGGVIKDNKAKEDGDFEGMFPSSDVKLGFMDAKIEGGEIGVVFGNDEMLKSLAILAGMDPDNLTEEELYEVGQEMGYTPEQLAKKLEITGGIFEVDVQKYVAADSAEISYTDGEKTTYAVGEASTASLLQDAGEGAEITVVTGTEVNGIPDGIKVNNETGNSVSVNGGPAIATGESTVAREYKWISVQFEDVTADDAEGEKLYNINIVAADGIINRLNSADLTFEFEQIDGAIGYEIIASNSEVTVNPVENSAARYEFHYNGKDNVTTDSAQTITIGQIKFEGYGSFDFAVDADATTNVVHTTKTADSLVNTFVPGGDTMAVLVIDDAKLENVEIAAPTKKLTVNIDFPNAVEDQDKAYQGMTVTIAGNDYSETISLGKDAVAMEDGKYTVEVENVLMKGRAYTVTVEGAGYRTARYTVTMNEDKTLNFWNNVKDVAVSVEQGKAGGEVTKNFLAGDIVKDNKINIYDLSAVVSYFGAENLVEEHPEYARYDLNRDGKIDSKDVAYVLVSWGE